MHRTLFILLFSVLSFATHAKSPTHNSHQELIDAIQKEWDKVKSYRADFQQTVVSKALGTREVTQGTLQVKKPLKLRWESGSPQKSTQILNGNELWLIRESQRRKTVQVEYYSDISKLVDARTLAFLSGSINIKKSYKYRVLTELGPKVVLALSPLSGGNETYLAEILKPSYSLGALKMENPENESRIEFSNIEMNVPLMDSLFQYEPGPKDIVHKN